MPMLGSCSHVNLLCFCTVAVESTQLLQVPNAKGRCLPKCLLAYIDFVLFLSVVGGKAYPWYMLMHCNISGKPYIHIHLHISIHHL